MWFTRLDRHPVRQLPMAMTRMFLFASVPRHDGTSVMTAPFLLAPTLVTPVWRRVMLFTIRMLQGCPLSICSAVLCMAVNVLGRTLLSDLLLLSCP